MGHGLPRRCQVTVRVEQQSQLDCLSSHSPTLDDPGELIDPLGEIDDPCSGGQGTTLVATPGGGHDTLREVREEGAKVVRLLEGAGTDCDERGEVGGDGGEEGRGDGAFPREEAEKRGLDEVDAVLQDGSDLREA